jgi:hypothetical protein
MVTWRAKGWENSLEHLQEFAKIYLANPVFCQLLKSYAKQKKKNWSPTVWHNSLAKSRSNLHQESWEKQNYACAFPPIKNLHQESFSILYFFFTLPPRGKQRWQPRSACAYMRVGRWVLPSWFVKLLEANFSCFAEIIWMPSWFAKLLELLLMGSYQMVRSEQPTGVLIPVV